MHFLHRTLILFYVLFLSSSCLVATVSYDFNSNILTITDSAREKSFDLSIEELVFMGSASDHYNVVVFGDNIMRVVVTPEGSHMSHTTEFNLNDIDPDLNKELQALTISGIDFYHHKFVFKGSNTKQVYATRDYVDVSGYEMPMETLCQQESQQNAGESCWGYLGKVSS